MAEAKTQGAGQRQISELQKINPLIGDDGDTYHVESIMDLLSFLVLDAADGSLTLSYDQAHGLAFLLDTCRLALQNTKKRGEV